MSFAWKYKISVWVETKLYLWMGTKCFLVEKQWFDENRLAERGLTNSYSPTSTLMKLLKFLLELSNLSVFQKGSSKSIMDVASTWLPVNASFSFFCCLFVFAVSRGDSYFCFGCLYFQDKGGHFYLFIYFFFFYNKPSSKCSFVFSLFKQPQFTR